MEGQTIMIRMENIVKIYNKGKKNEFLALDNINLEIEKGEMAAIVGKSGAGKSTLLHILSCMDRCDGGIYYLDGIEIGKFTEKQSARMRNEKIGIVMQDFALIENFTVYENVVLPLEIAVRKKQSKKQRVLDVLKTVSMENYLNSKIGELSGGQKQRVAIARAIVNDPDIIFADEPTGALDSENTESIMQLFNYLNEKGKTVVLVTHDSYVSKQCKKIIEINDGKICS